MTHDHTLIVKKSKGSALKSAIFFAIRCVNLLTICNPKGKSNFLDGATSSNLVDPASSHMLVSKIKPCMCKYKYCTAKLRMAHYISYSLFDI